MSEVIQWVIVGIIVVAAAVYLIKHLKSTDKGCCAGCLYARSCGVARDDLTECPTPERRGESNADVSDQSERSRSRQ